MKKISLETLYRGLGPDDEEDGNDDGNSNGTDSTFEDYGFTEATENASGDAV